MASVSTDEFGRPKTLRSVRILDDVWERAQEIGVARGTSASAVVEAALIAYIPPTPAQAAREQDRQEAAAAARKSAAAQQKAELETVLERLIGTLGL